jgi:hypothetical protein
VVNLDFVPDYPLEGRRIGIRDMVDRGIGVVLPDGLDEAGGEAAIVAHMEKREHGPSVPPEKKVARGY